MKKTLKFLRIKKIVSSRKINGVLEEEKLTDQKIIISSSKNPPKFAKLQCIKM
jgi:hypothetical protein